MKIYTKSGDRGSTKLIGGKDVEKHNVNYVAEKFGVDKPF